MPVSLTLMIVAGEPSGDAHAAALVSALRERTPDVSFFGATGPLMRAAGVQTIVNSDSLAIMGIVEVGQVFHRFMRAFRDLKTAAIEHKPDAVILVDWPEFNLRLATSLHRRGIRIIYYISPQLWAWRPQRVNRIKRDVDLLLTILPFESDWYSSRGVSQVEFVGHPLVGQVSAKFDREEFCRRYDLSANQPIVSFLPGSRHKELQRILPPMLDAIGLLAEDQKTLQFVISVAPSRTIDETKEIMNRHERNRHSDRVRMVHGNTREALAASDVAAIASGTATLEAALLSTPMVIVYKESPINWHTLGRLITSPFYGLVNLVAEQEIVKELMQDDLNGELLAVELTRLLEPKTNQAMRQSLVQVAAKLGPPGASNKAAEAVLEFLRQKTTKN
jgi:lipid-A-disaccharide synthase